MADFASSFAPNPCCYLANSGGTNITICNECKQCGCGGERRRCKRKKRRRDGCGCGC